MAEVRMAHEQRLMATRERYIRLLSRRTIFAADDIDQI